MATGNRTGGPGRAGLSSTQSRESRLAAADDDPEHEGVRLWSFLKDKKRLAWALFSVLKNNVVSPPLYYVLLCIEYLELLFLYIVFAIIYYKNSTEREQGSYSFEIASANNETESSTSFMEAIEVKISTTLLYITTELSFQIVVIGIIVTLECIIVLTLLLMASQFESPEHAKRSDSKSKLLSVLIMLHSKVLYTIEVILLTHIFINQGYSSLTEKILMFSGAILSLLLSSFLEFVLCFVYTIRVRLVDEIPWCAQKSIFPLLKSLFKLAQGVSLAVSVPQASAIVLFLASALAVSAYIYFQPYHNRKVYFIDLTFLSILFAEYFHLVIASFDTTRTSANGQPGQGALSDLVTVLLFFLGLFVPAFAHVVSLHWQQRLQNKLLAAPGTIKSEFEIEKALVLLTQSLDKQGSGGSSLASSSSAASGFGLNGLPTQNSHLLNESNTNLNKQIVGLILYHRERCRDFKRKGGSDQQQQQRSTFANPHGLVEKTCFCVQFDDSLLANRIIQEESKRQWDSHRFKQESRFSRKMDRILKRNNNREEEKAAEEENLYGSKEPGNNELTIEEGGNSDPSEMQRQGSSKNGGNRRGGLLPQDTVERRSSAGSYKGEKDLDWQQEEQKQFLKGILNPLFQAEYFISQSFAAQRKQQSDFASLLPEEVQTILARHNHDLTILDFSTVKVQTVVNIIYKMVKEYCEANPKSLRLLLFKAYFELFIMRKKYLAHQTLTRMQGEDSLSLVNYTQFQLDQQYLVEKASTLYQTKEDLLMDVDRIITCNYHYQQFYDLNEETAYQLSIFWTQLANPKQIDIEKLFETGVKTSELIKLTKDKFQELVALGIDKRNSNLYYMYANFNKYVLNSNDLYIDLMYKMKQIQNMNKTLQDNAYKDTLVTDVDKAGFLLVRGTFLDFGKILYANRKFCQMLGYTPEQINSSGKTINVLMPQIISEKHHTFLNIFRETGTPMFIQRQQHLFLKNATGYILPFKVYIKFHYDKQYGHVFCAVVNRTRNFHPFKNKKKHRFDEVLTFMTDDLGTICEISPSVTSFLGIPIKFVQQNQMDYVKISHLFKIDPMALDQRASKEEQTTINPDFRADSDSGKPVYAARYALQVLLRTARLPDGAAEALAHLSRDHAPQLLVDVKIKMAKVRHKDILTIRYFFVEILDNQRLALAAEQLFDPMTIISTNRALVTIPENHMPSVGATHLAVVNHQNSQSQQREGTQASMAFDEEREYSVMLKGDGSRMNSRQFDQNSSTSSDSPSKIADLVEKDIDQLVRNDKRTPKILKQILWLVLFAFLTTTIISAIIMGLFVSDSLTTKSELETVTSALQRAIYCSQVMNLLRSLLDIGHGFENASVLNNTAIWRGIQEVNQPNFDPQRFLSDMIISKLDALKNRQQALEFENQKGGITAQSLQIEFLNSQGTVEIQNQPPNVAINVLVSSIIDIVSNIGNLQNYPHNATFTGYYEYYNTLIKQNPPYLLIELEKQIFFVFENYVKVLDAFNLKTARDYQAQGTARLSETDKQRFLILMCIAVGTLLATLMLVSPVTFKIRRQKYQVLLFFLGLDEQITKQCQLKSTIFEDKFSSDQFLKCFDGDDDDREGLEPIEHYDINAGDDAAEEAEEEMMRENSMVHLFNSEAIDLSQIGGVHYSPDQRRKLMDSRSGQYRKRSSVLRNQGMIIDHQDIDLGIDSHQVSSGANILYEPLTNKHRGGSTKSPNGFGHKNSSLGHHSNSMGLHEEPFGFPRQPQSLAKTLHVSLQQPSENVNIITNEQTTTNQNNTTETNLKTIYEHHHHNDNNGAKDFQTFGPLDSAIRLQKKAKRASAAPEDDSQEDHKNNRNSENSQQIRGKEVSGGAQSQKTNNAAKRLSSFKPQQDQPPANPARQNSNASRESRQSNRPAAGEEDGENGEEQNSGGKDGEQEETASSDDKEVIQRKIKSISTKQQSSIFVGILILFLIITGYFVGIYIYTSVSIEAYHDSFSDLQTVHDRSICLSKLFFFAREDIITATEAQLLGAASTPSGHAYSDSDEEDLIQGFKSLSMNQLWHCMSVENDFTEIKRKERGYLVHAIDEIKRSESLSLCDMAAEYQSKSNLTAAACHKIGNDLFAKGLSLAHQDFLKSVLITLLDYFSRLPDFNQGAKANATIWEPKKRDFILSKLRQEPFLEYLYSNEFVLSQVNAHINDVVVNSIFRYIETLKSVQIAIFATLQIMLIIVTIYFFCHLFNKMKKDMLSSHLMIAMLPKHLLLRKDQIKIRDFLLE